MKNQKGFTIIQTLIFLIVFSISSFFMTEVLKSLWFSNKIAKASVTFQQIQMIANGNLANYEAWQKIISINPSMACLATGTCTHGTSSRIQVVSSIYDPADAQFNNVAVYNIAAEPTRGYDLDGLPCNTYSDTGNDACPIRVGVTWTVSCPTGGCNRPINLISLTFEYTPANQLKMPVINVANYSVINVDRRTLSSTGAYDECGMDTPPKIYVVEPNKVFNMPTGVYTSDIRGCLDLQAFKHP
jgi:hypothetical protein